jgi:hypothetical protein
MCAAGNEQLPNFECTWTDIIFSTVSKLKKVGKPVSFDTLTTSLGIVFALRIRWMACHDSGTKRILLEIIQS